MGMSIEDCINELQKLKLPISKHDLSLHFVEHTRNKTVETAIDTMRKYQKIVQIMERTVDDGTSMYDTLQEIEEVIEDGKID